MTGEQAPLFIRVWDVQHGGAIFLRTPNGTDIAIDLGVGTYDSGLPFSPLRFIRQQWNIQQLDGVIVTHPHTDHIGDIGNFGALSPRVLSRPRGLAEADIRDGNRSEDRAIVDTYLDINRRWVHPVAEAENPFAPANNSGVQFSKFIPTPSGSDLNNASMVCVVSYAGCNILIPGDNEERSWKELLGDQGFMAASTGTHVLVAPHHGRDSGFYPPLFEHISPLLTIVSDGRFGDTSATSRYSSVSSGWLVHRRSGGSESRKCVTTRSDGFVDVEMWRDANRQPQLRVSIR